MPTLLAQAAAASDRGDMIDCGTKLPIRHVAGVHPPVRLKRKFVGQKFGDQAKRRRKYETGARISIDEAIADEDGASLPNRVATTHVRQRNERVSDLQNVRREAALMAKASHTSARMADLSERVAFICVVARPPGDGRREARFLR
jgi:hypothetical protein